MRPALPLLPTLRCLRRTRSPTGTRTRDQKAPMMTAASNTNQGRHSPLPHLPQCRMLQIRQPVLINKHWDAHQHHAMTTTGRSSRDRAQSQPLCSPNAQTQTTSCSKDPAHGCKRPRATFAVLSTLQDDDDALPPPPPVKARGQKRGRSRGDPAMTSTAPAAAGPDAALLNPPTEQGSQSSPTLSLAPQGADLDNQLQLQDRTINSTIVQTIYRRRKRSKLTDAATAAQTCQQQPQLRIRKRKIADTTATAGPAAQRSAASGFACL